MTVDEARAARRDLEQAILTLVQNFENETGFWVGDISLTATTQMGRKPFQSTVAVEVKTNL